MGASWILPPWKPFGVWTDEVKRAEGGIVYGS